MRSAESGAIRRCRSNEKWLAICAGVGVLTGADSERVSSVFEREIETRYNVDADALVHEWLPEVVGIVRDEIAN